MKLAVNKKEAKFNNGHVTKKKVCVCVFAPSHQYVTFLSDLTHLDQTSTHPDVCAGAVLSKKGVALSEVAENDSRQEP